MLSRLPIVMILSSRVSLSFRMFTLYLFSPTLLFRTEIGIVITFLLSPKIIVTSAVIDTLKMPSGFGTSKRAL